MGKPTGFIEIHRKKAPTRPVADRIHDYREVYLPYPTGELQKQGARCMAALAQMGVRNVPVIG